jgi:serine phosphatase RsbU (regulator of sigma subunit)
VAVRQRLAVLGRSWRSSHALVAVPLALILGVSLADILAPPEIHLGPLLVAAPAITASFAGPRLTALIGALAVAAQTLIAVIRTELDSTHWSQIAALIVVSGFVVLYCYLRERRTKELVQVRSVAEAAQRVVLRPLPARIGPLRIASAYLAAEAEAEIGGDLYAVARTGSATRLLMGDVCGKGLTAVGEAALLLGAFRSAAHLQAALPDLVTYLDSSVRWGLAEASDAEESEEGFITAAVLEIPDQDHTARLVDCGHPPPLHLRDGEVTELATQQPAPPLGLGELLAERDYCPHTFEFRPGDILLLYTDGVTEARNQDGAFYPLLERVSRWAGKAPEQLVQRLCQDLLGHAGGRLEDDAALIAVQHRTPH